MANEVTVDAMLEFLDSVNTNRKLTASKRADVSTKKPLWHKQAIGFNAEEAIQLGEATSPGWALFINRDPTNFINLKVATSGAIFAKLLPGEFALLRLGSGAQAPYAIADTGSCDLEFLVIPT